MEGDHHKVKSFLNKEGECWPCRELFAMEALGVGMLSVGRKVYRLDSHLGTTVCSGDVWSGDVWMAQLAGAEGWAGGQLVGSNWQEEGEFLIL